MSLMGLSLPFEFEQPTWLWLVLLVPLLAVASWRSLAGLDPVRRIAALVVRGALVVLVVCCLAGVQRVQRNKDLTVMFLMDRSHSVEGLQAFQDEFIREASLEVPPNDRLGMIDFARNAFLQQTPMRGGYFLEPGRLPVMPNTDRTDVSSAMRLAMAIFPHDSAKRIVLMSDGNDNMGDLLSEARRAKADGIPVDVVPLWYERRNEVYFEKMMAPTYAEPGEQVPIRMSLVTQHAVSGTLSIYHNGVLVDLPPDRSHVDLKPGSNTFSMKLVATTGGAQTFDAVFRPDSDAMDSTALNNTASAFSFVSGLSRALLVTAKRQNDAALFDALRSENVDVDMKTAAELGEFDLLQMSNYSTIILSNIAAATFTDAQQQSLATYVKDTGSGLIMLGGDEAFGAGGWISSPVEDVMPVSFEVKHKRVIPRGALVLIMHSCEIPRGNYYGKEMAKKSVDTISSQDYLGVLAYSFSPSGHNWEVPLDVNTNKAAVKSKIDKIQIGDMNDFGPPMEMAYKELTAGRGRDAAQKHVIILSDGDPQGPSAALLANYVREKITVSTVGIGWGAHVVGTTLKSIADKTGGKYYEARNPKALPQIFVKESKVVRRPLIIDERFQPRIVQSDIELGIDAGEMALPPLGGMVLTSLKQSPNVVAPIVRVTDDGNDPVLARWQCELGKTVAFTSGHWPIWGEDWTRWGKFAKLWAQIVRWTMRQEAPANFDSYTRIDGNRGRIVIDALDKDASYLNFLKLQSNVVGPGNRVIPVQFTQTGPGHYEAAFDADQAGQYLASVQVHEMGQFRGTIRTGLSAPFSPEYRDLRANEALLRHVADITGGRWLDLPARDARVFSHDLPPTEAKRPAWEWVIAWLLLPVFLLDVAVRRLASWLALSIAVEAVLIVVLLFGVGTVGSAWGVVGTLILGELVGWALRFRYIGPLFDLLTHSVTVLGRAGDRSAAALEKLKTARDRVRDELDGSSPAGLKRIAQEEERASPAAAKRRFDVGEQKAPTPVGDLHEALGGAKAAEAFQERRRPPAPADAGKTGEEEAATSRLLRAKRRAKEDLDQKP